jgi:hypothetical protein
MRSRLLMVCSPRSTFDSYPFSLIVHQAKTILAKITVNVCAKLVRTHAGMAGLLEKKMKIRSPQRHPSRSRLRVIRFVVEEDLDLSMILPETNPRRQMLLSDPSSQRKRPDRSRDSRMPIWTVRLQLSLQSNLVQLLRRERDISRKNSSY